jgi:hypothetical protein
MYFMSPIISQLLFYNSISEPWPYLPPFFSYPLTLTLNLILVLTLIYTLSLLTKSNPYPHPNSKSNITYDKFYN